MKKQTFKILFILIITLFLSCSEDNNAVQVSSEDTLPPITQIGANTFGFLVDGNVFLYQKIKLVIHHQEVEHQEV